MKCKDCVNLRSIDTGSHGEQHYCRLHPNIYFGDGDLDKCYCEGAKTYTIEQLEKLHEKYRNMAQCDGYCPECGINLFFGWLNKAEVITEVTETKGKCKDCVNLREECTYYGEENLPSEPYYYCRLDPEGQFGMDDLETMVCFIDKGFTHKCCQFCKYCKGVRVTERIHVDCGRVHTEFKDSTDACYHFEVNNE